MRFNKYMGVLNSLTVILALDFNGSGLLDDWIGAESVSAILALIN